VWKVGSGPWGGDEPCADAKGRPRGFFRGKWVEIRCPERRFGKVFGMNRAEIRFLMRKTIVINTLLILGYYFILQLLIWVAMMLH
jgi:hypothetical protein